MKVFKSELVTIPVPNATTALKFYFPFNDNIANTPGVQVVKTKGIEFFPAQTVANAPDGTANMSSLDLIKGYLTLYIDERECFKIPLTKLMSVHLNTVTAAAIENFPHVVNLIDLADLEVNWTKSFVSFPTALAATNVTIVCAVYYDFFRITKGMRQTT